MLTYEPGERGEWLAATNAGRLVVVRMGAARSTIGSIWTSLVAGDGVQGVLDEHTSGGLFQTPPFAVLTWDGSVSDGPVAVRAIVRGDITLRLTTMSGQVAARLESQLAQQHVGDAPAAHTDTGPVRVITRREKPSTGIRLVPLADAVDRAVFNGQQVDDDLVASSWTEAIESLTVAETSVGRLGRLISRFRIRSKRDWNKVNLST